MERCSALAIAGGHVGVLRNRLWLFDVVPVARKGPILAWSAGSMALCERIVLFHDSPPQGPGDAEVFEEGFGVCPGIVPLPHARRRLRLDDPTRVSLFARRFAPARAVVMDDGAILHCDGTGGRPGGEVPVTCLSANGQLVPFEDSTAEIEG